ncbi:hypothetical protein RJT34_30344 [Clitoria ternatea]|uniref:HMG box domain-containing protein n=1 Tax=Clitoria ternatea TaxID=43366 RepID=A0AAN9I2J4_CLITE
MMTWHGSSKSRVNPKLQYFGNSIFAMRFLITTPPSNPSYPLSPGAQTSQHTTTLRSLSLPSCVLLRRLGLSLAFSQLVSLILPSFAMPKAKSDAKVTDNRLKRKGAGAGTKQSKKAAKDPNKPKRPPSAFFVFMSEFREQYKKEHPSNKSVAVVGKAGGAKWKSMSDAEKAPYVARAEKKKEEYEKSISAYNRKVEGNTHDEEDESDKSKSEVNDDEDDEEEEDDDE